MIEQGNATRSTIRFTALPERTLVDEPVGIRITGLRPGQVVLVRARTHDGALKVWEAWATFAADAVGVVDSAKQQPLTGTYDGVDAMGLFWSMTLMNTKKKAFFVKSKATPIVVTLMAEIEGKIVAEARIERLFASPGIKQVAVQEEGLIGTLFLPDTDERRPGVMILNGSDGGMHENAAALLASRGYVALALPYFGLEDLPKNLMEIPLEYFETAIHWLMRQPTVKSENIAVIGLSRGGELALLLGATFPEIKAVVAGAPSGVMHAGINTAKYNDVSHAAWTYRGEVLPYVFFKRTFFDSVRFMWKWLTHKPVASRTDFLRVLKKRDLLEKATIAVEHINGPVLLISGQDDQLWPSATFAEMVMQRLAEHHFPHPYRHLSYEGAGHFVCFPYGLPSLPPMTVLSPVGGMFIAFGGSAKANAVAADDSWRQILASLETLA